LGVPAAADDDAAGEAELLELLLLPHLKGAACDALLVHDLVDLADFKA
jgi:hypothetical protein